MVKRRSDKYIASSSTQVSKIPFSIHNSSNAMRKPESIESVLPKVNSVGKGPTIGGNTRSLASDLVKEDCQSGSHTDGPENETSRNMQAHATSRNRTTDMGKKLTGQSRVFQRGLSGIPRSYHSILVGNILEKNMQKESEGPSAETEADKMKRQARIKQQNELNSRLSVKKSALSKMLDAQKRKERIANGAKEPVQTTKLPDKERGVSMRVQGVRNKASRLDDADDDG